MRKAEFNALFREYARARLSPTVGEQRLVRDVYAALQAVLGANSCLQIGSYPRYTAITPLHDLDVLYVVGKWEGVRPDPGTALRRLKQELEDRYTNPTPYRLDISVQTHSVTIRFLQGEEERFAIDVVPSYRSGQNEFGEDMYWVPEILSRSPMARRAFYKELQVSGRAMGWIQSDPRGYITVASHVNERNADFRKAVKLVKAWKAACKDADPSFALKSFHTEQLLTQEFVRTGGLEIYDAIFGFFCDLPTNLITAHIADRADPSRKIDDYVDALTMDERTAIREARDYFLIELENMKPGDSIAGLLRGGRRRRASSKEAYLFDSRIPVLTEEELRVRGRVLPRDGGFRERILDLAGLIEVDRKIEFRTTGTPPAADLFKWKVKNDDASEQPRGEITDHRTLSDPEYTKFKGRHHVECYAIRDGKCIARARQNVVLGNV